MTCGSIVRGIFQIPARIKVETFKDRARKWRVRLRARNGRILMSSEAYSGKTKATNTAKRLEAALR